MSVFPKDQILVVRFEDYKNSRKEVLDGVVRFLDLGESFLCTCTCGILSTCD